MTEKSSNKPVKFQIDGDIKSPKESEYLKNVDKQDARRYKSLSILLAVFTLGCLGLMIWQYFQVKQLNHDLNLTLKNGSAQIFNERLDSVSDLNDSLFLLNANISLANEILVENSEQLDGLFFEVHLNFSGDFNLEAYKSELSRLESKEFDNREKLILARFRSFKKALLFENDLKKMGVTDVFLLGRIDGEIMTFKEALSIAQSQNK